jgi:hypothetical protein
MAKHIDKIQANYTLTITAGRETPVTLQRDNSLSFSAGLPMHPLDEQECEQQSDTLAC